LKGHHQRYLQPQLLDLDLLLDAEFFGLPDPDLDLAAGLPDFDRFGLLDTEPLGLPDFEFGELLRDLLLPVSDLAGLTD